MDLDVLYRDNGWYVALNGTYIVGFVGTGARERAESHREQLSAMLDAAARNGAPPRTDDEGGARQD